MRGSTECCGLVLGSVALGVDAKLPVVRGCAACSCSWSDGDVVSGQVRGGAAREVTASGTLYTANGA